MDFSLSDEQAMIADTVDRFVADHYGDPSRWERPADPAADRGALEAFAALGLGGLLLPHEAGGIGGGPAETMVVMAAFGRGLAMVPFISGAIVGARLLPEEEAIATGTMRLAVAVQEPDRRYGWEPETTIARRDGDGWSLTGAKTDILDAGDATHFVVPARRQDSGDIVVLLVPREAVTCRLSPTFDGRGVGEIAFDELRCEATLEITDGFERLQQALDWGIFALCAEATGAMAALIALTADYLRTRQQFGQPVGRFQALQHRVADMQSALERSRAIVLHAIAAIDEGDPTATARAVSAAKVLVGEAGRFIGESAVQLHGGIGVTDALSIGHYFKRLTAIDLSWGDGDHHLERYLALEPVQ